MTFSPLYMTLIIWLELFLEWFCLFIYFGFVIFPLVWGPGRVSAAEQSSELKYTAIWECFLKN